MPQCLQNVCFAVRVLNSYVVRSSLPLISSNCSGGTIRCRIPFLVQIEQLQSVTEARSAVTRKRTRPQWQPPCIVFCIKRDPLSAGVLLVAAAVAEQMELRRISASGGFAYYKAEMLRPFNPLAPKAA